MSVSFEGNKEFSLAWRLVEQTGANVFLTGNAGTGKTTFLTFLRQHSSKRIAVVAPTGIAAINAGGVTIHSFFQIAPGLYLPGMMSEEQKRYERFSKEKRRLIKALDLLVIDEISMVRADLLDSVDASLRRHRDPDRPFGGLQLLIIGDLGQLAPVVKDSERELLSRVYDTPFFFSSKALVEAGYVMVELRKVYRQTDSAFVSLLNKVRNASLDSESLALLNSRYISGFNPPDSQGYIRLTTHNARADEINEARLAMLQSSLVTYSAEVSGDFPEFSFPADRDLRLKAGAQVMFIRNNPQEGYYNGLIGTVLSCDRASVEVAPLDGGKPVKVSQVAWQNTRFVMDEDTARVREEVIGEFRQLPLRTAWAITIHKSQGLTFDRAIIDAAHSFAHGQTCVALSRCRSLEGLVLDSPLSPSAFISDAGVGEFINKRRNASVSESQVDSMADAYTLTLLTRMFDFSELRRNYNSLQRLVGEYLSKAYPKLSEQYAKGDKAMLEEIENVASRFRNVISLIFSMPKGEERDAKLNERVSSACRYFGEHLAPFVKLVQGTPTKADNKFGSKRLQSVVDDVYEWMFIESRLLRHFSSSEFTPKAMLDVRAKAILELGDKKKTPSRKASKVSVPADVSDAALYGSLASWRSAMSAKLGVPAYVILSNKALVGIANDKPLSQFELLSIPGIGNQKVRRFGAEIIEIISSHLGQD